MLGINSGPEEKQPVPLADEPSLQPRQVLLNAEPPLQPSLPLKEPKEDPTSRDVTSLGKLLQPGLSPLKASISLWPEEGGGIP